MEEGEKMKMHMYRLVLTAVLLLAGLIFANTAHADGVYGDCIFDYLYVAGHHDNTDSTETDGYNCFDLRRVRLGFKRTLNEYFAFDIRLEASVNDWYSHVVEGTSASTAKPFIKDAHGTWTIGDDLNIRFGLQGNPLFNTPENIWGYRTVEKIVTDLHKIESSRDLGVSLNGSMDIFSFTLMAGNGNGDKNDTYEGKEIFAVAGIEPMDDMILEAGVGYEAEDEDANGDSNTHTTIQGFLGYKGNDFQGGFHYAMYNYNYADEEEEDLDINLMSVFGAYHISPVVDILARYDMVDENPGADGIDRLHMADFAPTNTLIAGIAWKPAGNLQVIPNIEYVSYGDPKEEGLEAPDPDTFVRVTFASKF